MTFRNNLLSTLHQSNVNQMCSKVDKWGARSNGSGQLFGDLLGIVLKKNQFITAES